MNRKFVMTLVTAMLLLVSCGFPIRYTEVRGSGSLITEPRRVTGFDAIELNGIGTLVIQQGDKESLQVTTDDNLMKYIRTNVNGGRLVLETQDGVHLTPSNQITYLVTIKSLNEIETNGLGKVQIDPFVTGNLKVEISGEGSMNFKNITADVLNLDISGSGEINAAGEVNTLQIGLSGSGKIQASELRSRMGSFDISGSGHITAWVTDELSFDISGLGNLEYYGNPVVNADISGSGNVTALGQK